MTDLVGAATAGSQTPVARIASRYARSAFGEAASTIVGGGSSTPNGSALANGFAVSALDIDDGYRPIKGHPGAVTFPAVLAAGERAGCSGADLLTALVVAYEVAMRAGHLLHPLYDFYHGTGSWGPVGGAAGAARLLGLDRAAICHAMGIAEFHAPLTPEMRSVDHPSMLKDGIGWGAMVGVASALLAAEGFTGIPSLFDAADSGSSMVQSLGTEYLIRRLYVKPYACCRWAQPAVEAALAAADTISGTGREVERVRVHIFEAALHLRCSSPRTTEEAQFSLPWPVACALLDGVVGPDQVLDEGLADQTRIALAQRIEMVHDPELEADFPDRALAWVEIETKDGQYARSPVTAAPGEADSAPSDKQLAEKFMTLTSGVLRTDESRDLMTVIEGLSEARNLETLLAALRFRERTESATRLPGAAGTLVATSIS